MHSSGIQRATYIFGITMAVMMALSLVIPAITSNSNNDTAQAPTAIPPTPTPLPPTPPPPMTDFSGMTFAQTYLHSSGLYSVQVPSGWTPGAPSNTGTQVRSTMSNAAAISVIEVYLEKPTTPVESIEALSERLTSSALRSGWSRYTSGYEELSRRIVDDRLMIDFALADNQYREFIARHTTWLGDDGWIYVVRAVVPNNARDLLFFLMDEMPERITTYPQFMALPVSWEAYRDSMSQHIIRHPSTWQITDGGDGLPVSFAGDDFGGVQMRVEAKSATITDEDAARTWVEALGAGVSVVSVSPVTRDNLEGFGVAYSATNADGDRESGYVMLLNGVDGLLHIAMLQIPVAEVDLNSAEGRVAYERLAQTLDSFSLLELPGDAA